MVERLVWDQEVAGSNPVTPMHLSRVCSLVNLQGRLLLCLGFAFVVTLVQADQTQLPTFADIIRKNGTVGISDGSSLFIFSADGRFSQEPVGESGRTVRGNWATDQMGSRFTITGNWSWMNGRSAISDPRKMVMVIYPDGRDPQVTTSTDMMGKSQKIFHAYFEIEELTKTAEGH